MSSFLLVLKLHQINKQTNKQEDCAVKRGHLQDKSVSTGYVFRVQVCRAGGEFIGGGVWRPP